MRTGLARRLSRPGIRFRRLSLPSWISIAVLAVIALAAVLASVLAPHSPYVQQAAGGGPSAAHWMGLDSANRDIFTRLLYGARWSLIIGLGATAISLVFGAVIGAIAATSRKAVDEAIMRSLDVVMAFPGIALAAVLVAVFGGSIPVLVLAIAFLYMPSIARVVRANVLAQYGEDYVAAERIIGARTPHILLKHVAINCAAPILVFCTVMVADAIVFEASLSFIGAGVRPPDPSWGSVIADGRNMVLLGGWWATVFPGLLILITVLALNILAEGVSDAWAAPTARRADPVKKASEVDALEQATPGSGEITELPGLAKAAQRLAERARPLPQGEPILQVKELAIGFEGRHDGVDVVDGISFDVRPGEVLGLVGESGCGKSLTALTIMGLQPHGARIGGRILFDGRNLLTLPRTARRRLLGHDMAMIYQDALSSLNPAMTVRAQLKQVVRRGGRRSPAELLELVGLDPARTLSAYPHELSGGQRQRVLIAMALSREPKLIIADEPTTALDVTVQAQVIQLLLRLRAELGFALILVSHDLALVADVTDRVVVMYGGQIVEAGVTATLVGAPAHHYARGLLGSVLSLESGAARLTQIRGVVPAPADFPSGCRFADRCPMASEICRTQTPRLAGQRHHEVACHHPAIDVTASALATGASAAPASPAEAR
ncbi:dipeptide/oligopeptide/nickel ABC transporter permease/ATP-binding protein [Micromonospora halotolerans]|uniref:Dipeptide/oligopeptide/nickel ABC transporter permease/ATP-binding protein n=1 Tax=Micromonospora halotolerans TaxID=709879 RepID=A0ABY9ZV66_9ACTN|nr:dipeptide/oligopeptide/nickel ABC transporter permease/ATP-binding protein [Micromonospora halotolerans]WNM39189.1 dipeptide/oligopeptide/nickel ABC transporter permease/ATP-binding protein [Micromonospora halotolerans]